VVISAFIRISLFFGQCSLLFRDRGFLIPIRSFHLNSFFFPSYFFSWSWRQARAFLYAALALCTSFLPLFFFFSAPITPGSVFSHGPTISLFFSLGHPPKKNVCFLGRCYWAGVRFPPCSTGTMGPSLVRIIMRGSCPFFLYPLQVPPPFLNHFSLSLCSSVHPRGLTFSGAFGFCVWWGSPPLFRPPTLPLRILPRIAISVSLPSLFQVAGFF